MIATSYLLGVCTRRVERLCEAMGIDQLSKSQVSAMAKALDEAVEAIRSRPSIKGPTASCGPTRWSCACVRRAGSESATCSSPLL